MVAEKGHPPPAIHHRPLLYTMTTLSPSSPTPSPELSHQDLVYGGLEVTLRNHHTLIHDAMIGGVRLCVPLKKPSPDGSPRGSRSYSPVGPAENGMCSEGGREGRGGREALGATPQSVPLRMVCVVRGGGGGREWGRLSELLPSRSR